MTSKILKILIETILSKATIIADFTLWQVEEKGATTVMWGAHCLYRSECIAVISRDVGICSCYHWFIKNSVDMLDIA